MNHNSRTLFVLFRLEEYTISSLLKNMPPALVNELHLGGEGSTFLRTIGAQFPKQ